MSMASSERVATWKRSPCSAEPQSVCACELTMMKMISSASAHAASA